MRDFESERQRIFSRRALFLGGLQGALFSGLVARMYYLQVTEGAKYSTMAEDNRISTQLVAPARGIILDKFGEKLALNVENFRLTMVPEQVDDIEAMLKRLGAFVAFSERDVRRIRRDIARNRKFVPVTLADNLTWEQAAAIETRRPELNGISIEVGQIRHYPYAKATAHVLGYVGSVSEADMKADPDPLLSVPAFQIGKTGLEKALDKVLRGERGTMDMEVNVHGRIMRKISERAGVAGPVTRLTLDLQLQNYVQQRLMTERSAAAVVMDVQTGAIYAFASHPTFDSNEFSHGISQESYTSLMQDETAPLTNKVIAGLYPPGSTFKMVVALAALESGTINAGYSTFCSGAMQMGNHSFHCWKHSGHGTINMQGAIRESCDIFFYDVATKVGIDAISSMARKLGLGAVTGVDLPSERAGLVPDKQWKEATKGEHWQMGETLVVSIGQGAMLTTPLQLAVMTSRLVNGGKEVVPHLIKEIEGKQPERIHAASLGFDPDNLATIIAAMNSVVNDRRGTAFAARIPVEGQQMGGKTGTTQVRRISMNERLSGIVRNEDRPWIYRDHALFVGYAPIQSPRFAVAVIVEHGGGGSKTAAPLARDILTEAQRLDPTRKTRAPLPVAEFIAPQPAPADASTAEDEVSY